MSTKTLLSLITLERKVQTLHKKYIFVVRMRQAGSSQGFTTELGSDDSSSRWKGKIMAISHSEHLTSGPSVKRQMSGNSKCHLIPDRAQNTGTTENISQSMLKSQNSKKECDWPRHSSCFPSGPLSAATGLFNPVNSSSS